MRDSFVFIFWINTQSKFVSSVCDGTQRTKRTKHQYMYSVHHQMILNDLLAFDTTNNAQSIIKHSTRHSEAHSALFSCCVDEHNKER